MVAKSDGDLLNQCQHFGTSRSIFEASICNFTSPLKRDIEPAVHFHFKNELPL